MIEMLQSMQWLQQKCYKFNALVILLTLILCDRFSMDFAITVNPIQTISPSSIEYTNYDSDEVHTGSNKQFDVTTSGTNGLKNDPIIVDESFTEFPEAVSFIKLFFKRFGSQKNSHPERTINL